MAFRSLLSLLDRQSVRSVLTGQTGSIIGVLFSIFFLVVVIVLYLIITVEYFDGIYFASEYASIRKPLEHHFTSGRDFKVAIQIRNKNTGVLVNHTQLLQNLDATYKMVLPENTYLSYMKPCERDYFLGDKFVNPMQLQDCIIIPNDTDYNTLSILQIVIQTKCLNPFTCVKLTNASDPTVKLLLQNNYEVYFTSIVLNQKADSVFQINKLRSSEYSSEGTITSTILIYYNVINRTIDDSFLPNRKRRTIKELSWKGKKDGNSIGQNQIGNFGLKIKIATGSEQFIGFRYYKKIDYLIGIIGGGVFLFFMIFWIPCNYINRQLQKMQNTKHLMLQSNKFPYEGIINLQEVKISICYFLKNLIPCYQDKQTKIVQAAEQKLNLARMLKRLKVAQKNLQMNGKIIEFKPKAMIREPSDNMEEGIQADPTCELLQIPPKPLQKLKQSSDEIKDIYENNALMLTITEKPDSLAATINDQQYDKVNHNNSNQPSKCYQIKKFFAKIFRFFDVFGAKPNFIIEPDNSSMCGLCVTLLIIICSILTFVVTLRNMGQYQVFSTYDSHTPKQIDFQMVTGLGTDDSKYQLAVCFGKDAISYGWLNGSNTNRSVQVKFFTYQIFQNETVSHLQYDPTFMAADGQSYFQSSYNTSVLNYQNCLRPPHGTRFPVAGAPGSKHQAYFGFSLKPYCYGTPSQCQTKVTQTNQKFAEFINRYAIVAHIPINRYDPTSDQLFSEVFQNKVIQANKIGKFQSNWAITETQFLDEFMLIDDTSTWFVRQPPTPVARKLTYDHESQKQYGFTQQGVSPKYELIIRPNGQVNTIVKRGYKIDFLFGVIGGCFFFYYVLFSWMAKIYNAFKVRAKIAEIHYQEEMLEQSILNIFCHLSKFPQCMSGCCISEGVKGMAVVDKKIKKDLKVLEIAKKVQNCWRLSTSLYENLAQKDVSLIYIKQKIDYRQRVIQKQAIQSSQRIEHDFQNDYDGLDQLDDQDNYNGRKIANEFQQVIENNQMMTSNKTKKAQQKQLPRKQPQQAHSKYIGQDDGSFLDIIKSLDLFSIKSQLNFNGQRRVQSICGGICCMILTTFVFLIVVHFVNINASRSDYMVGLDQIVTQGSQQNSITLNNENFKFMLTFFTKNNFNFLNISAFLSNVGIKVVQKTFQRNQETRIYTPTIEEFNLVSCSQGYLEGWISDFTTQGYYSQIENGFCLPTDSVLKIIGQEGDKVFSNFQISIYNKGSFDTFKTFVLNYFPLLHLPTAVRNFNKPVIKFAMNPFRQDTQLFELTTNYNISFTKEIYKHQQDFYGQLVLQSYVIQNILDLQQNSQVNLASNNSYRNFTFSNSNRVKIFRIDTPGIGELFGIVGGNIILIFFTFACFAESFNIYRMKYLIGRQFYIFIRMPQESKPKKKNKAKTNLKQINNYNELSILKAWILSPIGYIQRDYNFNQTLKHITLIQNRIQDDLNIYNFTKKLSAIQDQINKNVFLQIDKSLKLTRLYSKQVYCGSLPLKPNQSLELPKNNRLTTFEQKKLVNAIKAKVDLKKIFNEKYIWKIFLKGISNNANTSEARDMRLEQSNQVNNSRVNNLIPSTNQLQQKNNQQDFRQQVENFQGERFEIDE